MNYIKYNKSVISTHGINVHRNLQLQQDKWVYNSKRESAYLLNVCLHRERSGEWLEAVLALCQVTEFHQELVVWLCMHDEMLHQQDIVWILPMADAAL
jgi:hypothetical protein